MHKIKITVSGAIIFRTIVSGELKLLEHEAARWLSKETLRSVDWLPADLLILERIEEIL